MVNIVTTGLQSYWPSPHTLIITHLIYLTFLVQVPSGPFLIVCVFVCLTDWNGGQEALNYWPAGFFHNTDLYIIYHMCLHSFWPGVPCGHTDQSSMFQAANVVSLYSDEASYRPHALRRMGNPVKNAMCSKSHLPIKFIDQKRKCRSLGVAMGQQWR